MARFKTLKLALKLFTLITINFLVFYVILRVQTKLFLDIPENISDVSVSEIF